MVHKLGLICTVELCRLVGKYIVGSEAYGFAYVIETKGVRLKKVKRGRFTAVSSLPPLQLT